FAVLHVCLAAWNLLDVLGVAEQDLKPAFKQVVDRLPKYPRRFHRHMCYALLGQPFTERKNVPRHRPKGPHLLLELVAWFQNTDAHRDGLLVHVQTRAPPMDDLHSALPSRRGGRHSAKHSAPRAWPKAHAEISVRV